MIFLLGLLACDPPAPAATTPAPASGTIKTAGGHYQIAWQSLADPIPLGELFAIEAQVTDKEGKPLEQGKVTIDARMPQHGHGMATLPEQDPGQCTDPARLETCTHPGGKYQTRGMKFHMQGEWTLTFAVEGPAGPDRAEVIYKL